MDAFLENLERKDVSFVWKRRLTVIAFCIRMFLIGVEYGIILPSVWLYLKTFNVETWFLGLVVASYTAAAMLCLPIVGRVFDKTKRTKELIMVMNMFEFVGNIIYALPFSPWLPLCGRFIAGLGDGFFAAASGEICHVFPGQKRTGIFALLEVGRVLGITLGPSLNFFLQKVDFKIGGWHINYATAPGLFMALVWFLMEIVTIFMVYNLSKQKLEEKDDTEINLETKKSPPEEKHSIAETAVDEHESDDKKPLLSSPDKSPTSSKRTSKSNGTFPLTTSSDERELNQPTLQETIIELCALEIIAIFYTDLVLWLAQTEFEVLAPLLTQEDFGWKESLLSIIYMVGGVELIVIFLCIWYFSSKLNIEDTFYLLFSLALTTCGVLLMIVYQAKRTDRTASITIFCIICFLVFTSIPLNLVASKSLLTKITRQETQGFTQGVYSSVSRIALILGPILGSAAFHNLALFGSMMALCCVVAFIWLVLCLERIRLRAMTSGV